MPSLSDRLLAIFIASIAVSEPKGADKMNDEFYTVKDVARKTHYSDSSIRHFIRIGLLKAKKCSVGTRKFLISQRDFEDFVRRFA